MCEMNMWNEYSDVCAGLFKVTLRIKSYTNVKTINKITLKQIKYKLIDAKSNIAFLFQYIYI